MKTNLLVISENIYKDWQVDEAKLVSIANQIFDYYINREDIYKKSCLYGEEFNTVSFDILYCDGNKTHEINREYRNKDYVADIITFAIFADETPEARFIFDGEINLGEIMLALDKITQSAQEKGVTKEEELCFLLAHGIMHLLGFDHQTEEEYNFVVSAQNKALSKIKDINV